MLYREAGNVLYLQPTKGGHLMSPLTRRRVHSALPCREPVIPCLVEPERRRWEYRTDAPDTRDLSTDIPWDPVIAMRLWSNMLKGPPQTYRFSELIREIKRPIAAKRWDGR